MSEQSSLPVLGFIGTGTINSALVTAFCHDQSRPYQIVVSPLIAEKAAALHAAFPDRVSIAQSLQEVADRSDWLIVAVLPEAGEEVYRGLKFRPEHKVVNLISDKSLQQIASWIGPTAVLAHLVPMSFIAEQRGPIILCPPDAQVIDLFSPIGEMVAVEERYHAAVLAAITAFGAPFFTLLNEVCAWAVQQGLPEQTAQQYTTALFSALAEQGQRADSARLHELAEEMTPGGLNYLSKTYINDHGGFKQWTDSLGPVMERLTANL